METEIKKTDKVLEENEVLEVFKKAKELVQSVFDEAKQGPHASFTITPDAVYDGEERKDILELEACLRIESNDMQDYRSAYIFLLFRFDITENLDPVNMRLVFDSDYPNEITAKQEIALVSVEGFEYYIADEQEWISRLTEMADTIQSIENIVP